MHRWKKSLLTIGLFGSLFSVSFGQKIIRVDKSPIVCYANPENSPTRVAPPNTFNAFGARTKSATIEVVYNGFSTQAQTAFQTAVDIWEGLISSPVTIRVSANWTNLGSGVLGSAGPTFYASDFDGAPQLNVAYPGALAEKLAGENLNDPAEFDIVANFNSNFNWYYNSTGTPGVNQYDLISVILHELGHGLGFVDTYNLISTTGEYGSFTNGLPFGYDINVETLAGLNLYQNFASPSTELGGQLVSNNLFYNSPLAIINNSGLKPKLYAPATWSGGSSIAHLDDNTYPAGNQNSLMSPTFGAQEVIHNPGPITLNLFKDMGWTTSYIIHEPIANTENTAAPAFNVIATVKPDETPGYDINTNEIFLHYYTSLNSTVVPLLMTPTGTPDEYSASIPAPGGNSLDYYYYISVADNLNRIITKPGKVNTPLQAPVQGYYKFTVGADTDAPAITHTPIEVVSFLDPELAIQVEIEERFALSDVHLEYRISGTPQPNEPLTLIDSRVNPLTGLTTYLYEKIIPLSSLNDGETIEYKIVAEDNSSNSNIGTSPASNYYEIIYKGLKSPQTNYINDFNLESDDFVGNPNDFSITQPAGFDNPAIHSLHPYEEAGNGNSINYIYTLRVPVTVQSVGATIKFDEIVLVEPGEPGSVFPNEDFYDYVVTEGSKDGGLTWIPVANGYDSRANSSWLAQYSPTAVGSPSLYKTRKLNLLDQFNEGDEVIIRFRLFSDPGVAGWGWAIDNLKIQIDDEPPTLLHQHTDFVKAGTSMITLSMEGTDNIAIDKVIVEVGVNNQPPVTSEAVIGANAVSVDFDITNVSILSSGDKIIYKLSFTDESGNSSSVPTEGYFEIPVVEFENAVNQYANDFNATSNDFVGNFFNIEQPAGFSDDAIHSSHNYLIGFGPDSVSNFTYTLTTPIVISSDNPIIRFDEIVLVEGHANGVVFGAPAFNDYVIVEGSKDLGETWSTFLDGYDAVEESAWRTAFTNEEGGEPELFRTRVIDMTETGDFLSGEEVLIRFRLFSNESIIGWGWTIDNLYIQDPITSTEKELEAAITVYPNPARENIIVEASGLAAPGFSIQLMNVQGQVVYGGYDFAENGTMSHTIPSATFPKGMYFVKISNEKNTIIRKVVKVD